ncbi:MAG: DedA family protein [Bacteroidales bacterium]|nr:DedA family protein [Bacteroidales bacterium]
MIVLSIFDASTFFDWFVNHANYWFVFIFMAIESSFIPFPSELVVPPAAYLATAHGDHVADMNVYLIVIVATAGALAGSLVNYYLALWLGRPIVYAFANSRLGHICLLDKEKVEKAEVFFDKHGAASTFFGRLVPAVRQLISIPAGLARMNIGKFIIFTCLGAGVWNCVLAALGYWLGKTVPFEDLMNQVEQYNDYLTYAGLAIGVGCILFILFRAFHKKQPTL